MLPSAPITAPGKPVSQLQPRAMLEVLKPVTWFPPMWAFGCGVVSGGAATWPDWALAAAGVVLAGPLVCGTSQAVNDWFDRHVDAINEPHRPIPSGRLPGRWGLWIAIGWTLVSLLVGFSLGPWVGAATVFGLVLAWAYSAPPVRLKQNGWWGNLAVGICYEGLPWITGAAVVTGLAPSPEVLTIALLYSLGAHGIMVLNDFKSVSGDTQLGLRSIPVMLGEKNAGYLACATMAGAQLAVIFVLLYWGSTWYAAAIAASLLIQLALMRKLLRDPKGLAPWYNATGVSLYVTGMLIAAFALRGSLAT